MASLSDTNKGYPEFVRLNPIIFWSYEQVWTFIKGFQIPYCSLYDEGTSSINLGYTYLGNKGNTTKNSTLYDRNNNKFKKAYEAESETEQQSRLHRTLKEKK
jgi:FAD synthetase